mmetsp:Transcript_26280/g.55478  ORF Transcript_26280/g.55478 Transcript_26280/m.55478 type:complete len:247 (+) Transcript_26280:158-898(+)
MIPNSIILPQEDIPHKPRLTRVLKGNGICGLPREGAHLFHNFLFQLGIQRIHSTLLRGKLHNGNDKEAILSGIILDHQTGSWNVVLLSSNLECQIGNGGIAVNIEESQLRHILRPAEGHGHTHDFILGTVNQRGSRVHDTGNLGRGHLVVTEFDLIHSHEPVSRGDEVDPVDLALHALFVVSTDGELAGGVIAEEEGEHGFVHAVNGLEIVDKGVDAGIAGDDIKGQSEDAVKFGLFVNLTQSIRR